jgi:predicted dehydrogenase
MSKEERLLRVGVLGAGPVSQAAHFEACRKARNVELYAICDSATDLLARMTAVHEPRSSYAEYDRMLADPNLEAVLIAVADQFHILMAKKALSAGKHVLVEKPLGVSVEECQELVIQQRETKLVVQVGHNRRFDPGLRFARDFIRQELGPKLSLKAWYYDSTLRYTMTDNLQPIPLVSALAKRPAGNPKSDRRRYLLLAHGSHLLDSARYLGGEITSLAARLLARAGAFCWFIAVEFADGSLGHLDLQIPVRGDFEEGFQISGEGGSVQGRLPLSWYYKSGEVECFSVRDSQYRRPLGADAFSYKLQLEAFADTILHGREQVGATAEDGLATARALAAISRSVATGGWVRLQNVQGEP